jgi:hypothetical protein
MQVINPSSASIEFTQTQLQWAQSVYKALTAGIDMGVVKGKNAAGVYNQFQQGNGSGILIRVGAAGTGEQKYVWTASNTAVVITHGLNRQPIGFFVVDKDKAVDVYRTAPPTDTTISLAPTDATVNTTIYIF